VGCTFYAANLHKWLSAPRGAGFLYARHGPKSGAEPLVRSHGYKPRAKVGTEEWIDGFVWDGNRDYGTLSLFSRVANA
jgi:isopenicillin-N epimerase